MEPAPIAAVIPAAGASVRMGPPKLLLEVGGAPLLLRAVQEAALAGLAPVVVVLAPGAAAERAALEGLPCRVVENPAPGRGQGSSVAAGLAALPPEVVAAVVQLPDMPRVDAAMLSALVARFRVGGAALVVSEYGDTVAPPVLFGRPLWPELAAAPGDNPGKVVIARHRARAAAVRWPADRLADIDTPAELAAARGGAGG